MVKVVVSDNKGLVQYGGQNGSAVENNLNIRGRMMQTMTHADADARNHVLTAAQIKDGILVHTSVTGPGTLTTPTAAQIIAGDSGTGALEKNGDCIIMYWHNAYLPPP